jgi:hypothetical protein
MEESYRYFVRVGKEEEHKAEELLHADFMVHYEGAPSDEKAFVTSEMTEREYEEAVRALSGVKQCIRLLQD